jgi:hypothetical protein
VPRRIELTEVALVIRYTGLAAWARLTGKLTIPFASIRSVGVGIDSLPGMLTPRIGVTFAPLGDTRRGLFWWQGKRVFLDFGDPSRAVVLDLEGRPSGYDLLALEPETDPEAFAEQLRAASQGSSTLTTPSSTRTGNTSTGS